MGLTKIRCDWAGVSAPLRRCGPHDFAKSLLDELHAVQKTDLGAWLKCSLSDDSVAQIIELAYYASLLEEEGRTPRLRVIFGVDAEAHLPYPLIARFDPPIRVGEVWDLVKVAPAFSRRNCALWLAESKNADAPGIECRGLLNAGASTQRIMIGYPDPLATSSRTALEQSTFLKLSIEGSGYIRASFGLLWEQTLKGGQIRPTVSFSMTPPLGALFLDVERIIRRRCAERYPELHLADYVLQNAREVTHLWTRILDPVVAAQHGGAILVVPDAATSLSTLRRRYNIADGFPVDLDLGSQLVEFSASCARLALMKDSQRAGMATHDELNEMQNDWFARRNSLYSAVDTLAGLTAVDGCVVLDRGLRVHLFGGRIQNARADHQGARVRPVRDWYEPDISLDQGMSRLGTRNQSACGFCREHPHALAFVVSQDTDLRVYTSDMNTAYAFEALAPC